MGNRTGSKVNLSDYPLLQLIGQTPLVKIDLFTNELPNVEIYAKVETYNPGGSIKDRPVLRMLTEAIASGELTREKSYIRFQFRQCGDRLRYDRRNSRV